MQAHEDLLMKVYDAAQLAVEFAGGMTQAAFMVDAKTHSAVLYQLMLLGQAAGDIEEQFRTEHPQFPWKAIDAVSAAPTDIELNDAWDILWSDIPSIVAAVEKVIPRGGDS